MQALESDKPPPVKPPPVQRTDVPCKNCAHIIGNHTTNPPGCHEQLPDDSQCRCDWSFEKAAGLPEKRKLNLGDWT